jgi:hypothetical protein
MRRRFARSALTLLAVAGLLLSIVPAASAAGWADFGKPSATSTFATGVTFTQPVTLSKAIARAELLLTAADSIGPTVIVVPAPGGSGAVTLKESVDPAEDGHIQPNTPMVARWRLIPADDPDDVQVGPEIRIVYADDRFEWKTEAGELVRVHYYEGTSAFGKRALRIAEDAIRESSELLGVTESEPIDFFIYAQEEPFDDALGPGLQENVGGLANHNIRTLFGLIPPAQIDDAWVGIVIPHELLHLVFNTASTNPYHSPPRWLNEGLAVYVSQGYDQLDRGDVERGARAGTLIPLDGLTGQFPRSDEQFSLAYSESVSAVDYLIRTYDTDALVSLIRSYADGRTDDEAFTEALGIDMSAFGEAWLADLKAKAPTKFGPQPAPPGPVPAAWAGTGGVTATPAPGAATGRPGATPSAAAGPAAPVDPTATVRNDPTWLLVGAIVVAFVVTTALVIRDRRQRAARGLP